jgi:hypothetical protein
METVLLEGVGSAAGDSFSYQFEVGEVQWKLGRRTTKAGQSAGFCQHQAHLLAQSPLGFLLLALAFHAWLFVVLPLLHLAEQPFLLQLALENPNGFFDVVVDHLDLHEPHLAFLYRLPPVFWGMYLIADIPRQRKGKARGHPADRRCTPVCGRALVRRTASTPR